MEPVPVESMIKKANWMQFKHKKGKTVRSVKMFSTMHYHLPVHCIPPSGEVSFSLMSDSDTFLWKEYSDFMVEVKKKNRTKRACISISIDEVSGHSYGMQPISHINLFESIQIHVPICMLCARVRCCLGQDNYRWNVERGRRNRL